MYTKEMSRNKARRILEILENASKMNVPKVVSSPNFCYPSDSQTAYAMALADAYVISRFETAIRQDKEYIPTEIRAFFSDRARHNTVWDKISDAGDETLPLVRLSGLRNYIIEESCSLRDRTRQVAVTAKSLEARELTNDLKFARATLGRDSGTTKYLEEHLDELLAPAREAAAKRRREQDQEFKAKRSNIVRDDASIYRTPKPRF